MFPSLILTLTSHVHIDDLRRGAVVVLQVHFVVANVGPGEVGDLEAHLARRADGALVLVAHLELLRAFVPARAQSSKILVPVLL